MREAGPAGPGAREPDAAERDDHSLAVGRETRVLVGALLVCCAAALVLGAIGAAVVWMSGGAASDLVPLLTFVALGQVAAVVSGGAAVVGSVRQAGRSRQPGVVPSVGRTFRAVARGLLAACVLVATAWVLARPDTAAGALTGAVLAAQVAAVLLVAGGRLSAWTSRPVARR